MGWYTNWRRRAAAKKQRRFLLLGLDNAGKTSVLYALQQRTKTQTEPTIGHNADTVQFNGYELTVWDPAGQDKTRIFWRHYYHGTNGILFVVDSSDHSRLSDAKRELHAITAETELENVVVLVLANKQDSPNAVPIDRLTQELDLAGLKRTYKVQPCVAVQRKGVEEGVTWLCEQTKPLE